MKDRGADATEGEARGAPAKPWWKRLPRLEIRRPRSGERRLDQSPSRFSRLAYALVAGGLWGVAALLSPSFSSNVAVIISVFGILRIYFGTGAILAASGALLSTIHLPTRSLRAPGAGYSRAEAMAVRGLHEKATRWFREARRREDVTDELDQQISLDLIELYRRKMEEPRRAIPELARFAERHPAGPGADRIRRELRQLKEELVEPEG